MQTSVCFDTYLVTCDRSANHKGAMRIHLYVAPCHRLSKTMCPRHRVHRRCGLGFPEEKASPISISDHDLQFDVVENCIYFVETQEMRTWIPKREAVFDHDIRIKENIQVETVTIV